ncbi:MAG: ribokinase [Clostridia bacterium]|nr:ribokinase [Clostridia bacterium]NCC75505.1 ribokinase [Clostridia bacterium]
MNIAVVGSLNMDMVVTAPRIPLKGETITGQALHFVPGGKGANQAVALGRLGADVTMFGCVGDDDFGRQLIENLAANSVKAARVRTLQGVTTGVAMITVGDGDNSIVVVPGANGQVGRAYIDSIKEELLQNQLVILQLEIPLDTATYVVDLCHQAGVAVLLNPAPALKLSADLIEKITFVTPNEHEAAIVFDDQGDYRELLRRYPEKLIITQGSAGASFAGKNGEVHQIPASPATVVDTTGAGDTFNAALAYAWSQNLSLDKVLLFANCAAGLSTEKFGAQGGMPTLAQVTARLT